MADFNLVDQPWIPVRTLAGAFETWNLRDTLLRAQSVRDIEDASPLVLVALHRFLLAVLHRALEGPANATQTAGWLQDGFPAGRIDAYLKRWRDRFDLFHPTYPFFQVPDLGRVARPKPWTILLAEEGSFNTTPVFNPSNRTAYRPAPTAADQAARALLTYQTFALGATIRVLATSAPAAPVATAAIVTVRGDDLRATLCLNLVPYANITYDVPIWERHGVLAVNHMRRQPRVPARGHVQAYTWPSRSVLLLPQESNGAAVVPEVLLAAGVRLEPGDAYRNDPMVACRYNEQRGIETVRLRPDHAFWRDFDALLPRRTLGRDEPPQVVSNAYDVYHIMGSDASRPKTMVAGLCSNHAKIESWRAEFFELPATLRSDDEAHDTVKAALDEAETGGKALRRATWLLAGGLLSHGRRDAAAGDKRNVARSLPGLTDYWSGLADRFPDFLSRLKPTGTSEEALIFWLTTVHRALRTAWEHTARAAGDDAAALRAIALGERALDPVLAALYKRIHPV